MKPGRSNNPIGNPGAHPEGVGTRKPLNEQTSAFSRMLAKLTDDNISGYEHRERLDLERRSVVFLRLLQAEHRKAQAKAQAQLYYARSKLRAE